MKSQRTIQCGPPTTKQLCPKEPDHQQQSTRYGVSLVEVLMSLLVMGVGVTAVATLFPMAVLRSIQGTQLTNAALLRYNAESMIDLNRNLIHDPDNDGNRVEHYTRTYVVDPLGYNRVTGAPAVFGNGGLVNMVRYSGGYSTRAAATNLVVNPDTWITKFEDDPASSTATSVTMANIDAATVNGVNFPTGTRPNDPPSRVVLTDSTGKKSIVRYITDVTAGSPTLIWTDEDSNSNNILDGGEDANGDGILQQGVPASFNISKVRVQTRETYYTWLLTVKNNGTLTPSPAAGNANINVVVFFNRGFTPLSEHVFSTGNKPDNVVRLNSSQYRIEFDGSDPDNVPFIQKGSFLFDVKNARWYRIQQAVERPNSYLITLDEPPPNGQVIEHAMFPRGVVDVYPIAPKNP